MKRALVTVALAVLCGCGGSGGGNNTGIGPTPTPVSLTITPAATTLLKIGDDQVYTATVRWSDGHNSTETATWTSDNASVATIDGTGKAHAVGSGEVTLVAHAQNLQSNLKIRVVPNYQGTWNGDYTVRSCTATGAFTPSDWCGSDGFTIGEINPITIAITQSGDALSGTISLGAITTTLDASSSIRVDGFTTITAQGTYPTSGVTVIVTLNPVNLRADGPNIIGSFTVAFTVAGVPGSASFTADLNTMTRSSALTATATMPTRVGTGDLREVIRLMRQR